ncbi:MAG TPA: DMT family transporter [Candidatus Baltobacteraceae bacterium]
MALRARSIGLVAALVAMLGWGTGFPVIAMALLRIDAYWLSAIRFGIALPILAVLLWRQEGRSAFGFDGRWLLLIPIGVIGMCGNNVFMLVGIRLAGAEHASLLFATVPLMTAFYLAARNRVAPAPISIGCFVAAFAGIALVITRGNFSTFIHDRTLGGDLLVFLAALVWVGYTVERSQFPSWSSLRFTTVTLLVAEVAMILVAAGATAFFHTPLPDGASIAAVGGPIVYSSLVPVIGAVVCYNEAIERIGASSAALFLNGVPLVTFVFQAVRGIPLSPIEYAGAAITIVALAINTLASRRPRNPAESR